MNVCVCIYKMKEWHSRDDALMMMTDKKTDKRQRRVAQKSQNSKNARSSGVTKVSASRIIARKEEPSDHVNDTDVMNDPGCTRLPWPNSRFLSSQVFNAFTICATLSGRCSRTSLILTLPILTSLFTKKSNSENSPSIALSSYG
jgi:hypothetical protein